MCADCEVQIWADECGSWVDETGGDCCWETDGVHRPRPVPGGLLDEFRQEERLLEAMSW